MSAAHLARLADSSRTFPGTEKCHVWTAPSWQGLSSRPQASALQQLA